MSFFYESPTTNSAFSVRGFGTDKAYVVLGDSNDNTATASFTIEDMRIIADNIESMLASVT